MKGNPMQNPWMATTHGRAPSAWRSTAAVAAVLGPKAIHRSLPGSPGWGAKPLSQEIRS